MWGWVRLAAVLISRRNRSAPRFWARSGIEDLDRDLPVVLQVLGQVDRGHAAAADLAFDAVAISKGRPEASLTFMANGSRVLDHFGATNLWYPGFSWRGREPGIPDGPGADEVLPTAGSVGQFDDGSVVFPQGRGDGRLPEEGSAWIHELEIERCQSSSHLCGILLLSGTGQDPT